MLYFCHRISLFLLFLSTPFSSCIFCIFLSYFFLFSFLVSSHNYLSFIHVYSSCCIIPSWFILNSLFRPHQFYFNLSQLYLCLHPFVAFCKSKRRFPFHAVMRRASWLNLNVVKFSIQLTVTCNRISTFQWRRLLLLL